MLAQIEKTITCYFLHVLSKEVCVLVMSTFIYEKN